LLINTNTNNNKTRVQLSIDEQVMQGLWQEFYRLIESCAINALTINDYLNSMRDLTFTVSS